MTDSLWDAAHIESELRREWWLNHGHDYHSLYGDDGEMQCLACPADFKRQPLEELQPFVWVGRVQAHGQETPSV